MNGKRALVVLAIFLSALSTAHGRQKTDQSETLRTAYFDQLDIASILRTFAYDYDVTIGLKAHPEKPQSQITLNLGGANFGRFRSHPDHSFEVSFS